VSEEMEYVLRNVIEQKEKEIKDLRERLDFEKYTVCQMNALGEALKVKLRHNEHKRCVAMASKCRLRARWFGDNAFYKKEQWALKWHRQWLELAEKFKEAK